MFQKKSFNNGDGNDVYTQKFDWVFYALVIDYLHGYSSIT